MRKLFRIVIAISALFMFASNANAVNIEVRKGKIIELPRPAAHVFVANPDVADIDVRSPNFIYVYGTAVGETTLHAMDADNNVIFMDDVVVSPNLSNFDKAIKRLMPDSDISFDSIGKGIILKGTASNPKEAELAVSLANSVLEPGQNLVNMLEVKGSDQVMLRVRVAEVSRTEVQQFGINLSSIFTRGSFSFGLFTGRDFLDASNNLITQGNAVRLGGNSGRFVIDSVIDALETEGLLKTLAEPNLTAKSGSPASFLAGGEFPIPVPQEGGAIGIEYRQYGVSLSFTPTVLSNDKISLQVAPEVSTLVDSTVNIASVNVPGLATRKASTTVELGSGESFAIAGLLQNNSSNNVNKFPWLGDLPVLGALFRSNNFQNDETELVIIVTPYIVSGVEDPTELALPTDGLEYGNDFERIFLGALYKSSKTAGRTGKPGENVDYIDGTVGLNKLYGSPGFILEE